MTSGSRRLCGQILWWLVVLAARLADFWGVIWVLIGDWAFGLAVLDSAGVFAARGTRVLIQCGGDGRCSLGFCVCVAAPSAPVSV